MNQNEHIFSNSYFIILSLDIKTGITVWNCFKQLIRIEKMLNKKKKLSFILNCPISICQIASKLFFYYIVCDDQSLVIPFVSSSWLHICLKKFLKLSGNDELHK